MELYKEDN